MRLNRIIRMCVLVLTSTIVIPTATYAEETEASLIRSMEARLPSLMELKLAGKVGETNLALVESICLSKHFETYFDGNLDLNWKIKFAA